MALTIITKAENDKPTKKKVNYVAILKGEKVS